MAPLQAFQQRLQGLLIGDAGRDHRLGQLPVGRLEGCARRRQPLLLVGQVATGLVLPDLALTGIGERLPKHRLADVNAATGNPKGIGQVLHPCVVGGDVPLPPGQGFPLSKPAVIQVHQGITLFQQHQRGRGNHIQR